MTAFYLKYRPQKISDLDLKSARESLSEILSTKQVPHAFLLVGPKGTGKTSSARIIAKAVNCSKSSKTGEPCNKCEACKLIAKGGSMDLIEIDAASNRGIDDIRELREKISLSPSALKFKVYIIDEVHMLTKEAFNALLKTLEEPPKHAKFVLCTTEPHKLPGTVMSRCFRVDFKKASIEEVVRSLSRVVKGEKIGIKKQDLDLIAKRADGSFRDAVKILEQLSAGGKKISHKKIKAVLEKGLGGKSIDEWLELVYLKKAKEALEWLGEAEAEGVDFRSFTKEAVERLRQTLLIRLEVISGEALEAIDDAEQLKELIELMLVAANQVKGSVIESLPLELAVVEWAGRGKENGPERAEAEEVEIEKVVAQKAVVSTRSGKLELEEVVRKWQDVLEAIRPHNHSLEALLRATRPTGFEGSYLMLEVFYKFHKERLEVERYRSLVEEVASKVLVAPVKIRFYLSQKTEKVVKREAEDDMIKTAEEVFGVKVD